MPGRPARFTVTVKTSFRYIETGSAVFSPTPNAGPGVAGVRRTSHLLKASMKSRAMSVRNLGAGVVGVIVAGRKHVGSDQDAALHFLAEALGAALLIELDDIAHRGGPTPEAHPVIPGQVRGCLGRSDNIISGQRVFGVRQ